MGIKGWLFLALAGLIGGLIAGLVWTLPLEAVMTMLIASIVLTIVVYIWSTARSVVPLPVAMVFVSAGLYLAATL